MKLTRGFVVDRDFKLSKVKRHMNGGAPPIRSSATAMRSSVTAGQSISKGFSGEQCKT